MTFADAITPNVILAKLDWIKHQFLANAESPRGDAQFAIRRPGPR